MPYQCTGITLKVPKPNCEKTDLAADETIDDKATDVKKGQILS
jgi:hypothetical protein